jgi:hypothetical protein
MVCGGRRMHSMFHHGAALALNLPISQKMYRGDRLAASRRRL